MDLGHIAAPSQEQWVSIDSRLFNSRAELSFLRSAVQTALDLLTVVCWYISMIGIPSKMRAVHVLAAG